MPNGCEADHWLISHARHGMPPELTEPGRAQSAGNRLNVLLERFSHHATAWTGSTWAFTIAVATIVIWAVTGPLFGFSDTWQLVINTGTTIITFLMVFLIQRTQNKDSLVIQMKLNELLAAQQGASNQLINLEDWHEDDLKALHDRFAVLSDRLKSAADDCQPHSIAEAQEALQSVQQHLYGDRRGRKRRVSSQHD
jgi:low affinity Fe/Cu permease